MNENEIRNIEEPIEDMEVYMEESSGKGSFGLGMLIGAGLTAAGIYAVKKVRKHFGKNKLNRKKSETDDLDDGYEEIVAEIDAE